MASRTGRPWRRLKARVIRRDAGICHLCGKPGADTADHLIPWSKGGTDTMANLKAAHQTCNKIRQTRPVGEVQAELTSHPTEGGWDW